MAAGSGLLIIDLQNDFCPGGALPVANGEAVVAPLNRLITRFVAAKLPIFASRDWHPATTRHFLPGGGPWPVHCVQGTAGAAFHPQLQLPATAAIISKGEDPERDDYSACAGRNLQGLLLPELLRQAGVSHLYVGGLATDYCVRATVLDLLAAGFGVTVVNDAIAGVDLHAGDSDRACAEMRGAGARFCEWRQVAEAVEKG